MSGYVQYMCMHICTYAGMHVCMYLRMYVNIGTIYTSDIYLGKPLCESTDGLLVFGSTTRNSL